MNRAELISKLRTASVIMGNLPERPGYNGSILQIDDCEAETISKTIDEAVTELEADGKPLLDSEIVTMYAEQPTCDQDMIDFARAIEQAHGIKGS